MANCSTANGCSSKELGWIHVRRKSSWKRRFVSVSDGKLRLYSSEKKNQLKGNLNIIGAAVDIVCPDLTPNYVGEAGAQLCSKFLSQPLPLECNSCETCLVVIQPSKGRMLCLLAMNQRTAKDWKVAIEEAEPAPSNQSEIQVESSSSSERSKSIFPRASVVKRFLSLRKKVDSSPELPTENLLVSSEHTESLENKNCCKIATTGTACHDPLWPHLDTLQGCTDFLLSSYLHAHGLEHAKSMITLFKGCYQMGDSSLSDEFRLEAWKGTIRRIIGALVDQLLKANPLLGSCMTNDEHMDQFWLACETWIFGSIHEKIMGACKQMFSSKDKMLYQSLLRLEKIDPSVFGVRQGFEHFVSGDALCKFKEINRFKTPLEKAICIQRTMNSIIEGIRTGSCTNAFQDTEEMIPCTDDLLSFMVLLIVRSKVQSLHANACYMSNFLHTDKDDGIVGELGFHVTNFVAACNYLDSSEIEKLMSHA